MGSMTTAPSPVVLITGASRGPGMVDPQPLIRSQENAGLLPSFLAPPWGAGPGTARTLGVLFHQPGVGVHCTRVHLELGCRVQDLLPGGAIHGNAFHRAAGA